MNLLSRATRRLADVPRYQPGRAGSGPITRKLSSNEAPLGPAPSVRRAISVSAMTASRYPQEDDVRRALADAVGASADQLLVTNGSDELCSLITSAFVQAGDSVVTSEPGYAIDTKVTALVGANTRPVALSDGRHDLPALAKESIGAALLWLPSPHNPTGTSVDPDDLGRFLDDCDPACLVVLDEAYRGYLNPSLRPDVLQLLQRHPNLVIQRTFSKDYALAGLRLGYGLARPEIIDLLFRVRAPFSVNTVALGAVHPALTETAWRDMSIAQVVRERRRLEHELTTLGVEHFPSEANFVTARIPHDTVVDALAAHHLTVRPGEGLGLPGWVRISIGTPQTMALLRRVLRDALGTPATGGADHQISEEGA